MPMESAMSRRRDAATETASTGAVIGGTASAEVGLRAGPVAHDVDGVLVAGVPGGVQQPAAALRGALPDPPAIVRVERRRLGADRVAEPVARADEPFDRGRAVALGLA